MSSSTKWIERESKTSDWTESFSRFISSRQREATHLNCISWFSCPDWKKLTRLLRLCCSVVPRTCINALYDKARSNFITSSEEVLYRADARKKFAGHQLKLINCCEKLPTLYAIYSANYSFTETFFTRGLFQNYLDTFVGYEGASYTSQMFVWYTAFRTKQSFA